MPTSVWPRCAVPEMTGRTVFTGGALTTFAVGALACDTTPSALVTVTSRRMKRPISLVEITRVELVALVIAVQFVPSTEDCHWYLTLLPMPSHTPAVPVSVSPRCAVPHTVGGAVLTGGELGTTTVGALAAVTVASGLVAVTTTRTRLPTSSTVSV